MDFKMTPVDKVPDSRTEVKPYVLTVPVRLLAPRMGRHIQQVAHINLVDRGAHMACEIWLRDGTAYRWGSA